MQTKHKNCHRSCSIRTHESVVALLVQARLYRCAETAKRGSKLFAADGTRNTARIKGLLGWLGWRWMETMQVGSRDLQLIVEGGLEAKLPTIWTDGKHYSSEEVQPWRR